MENENSDILDLSYFHVRFTLWVLETIRRLQMRSANAQTSGVCFAEIVKVLQHKDTGGDALDQVKIALTELKETGFIKKTSTGGYIAFPPFASLCNVQESENPEELWSRLGKFI